MQPTTPANKPVPWADKLKHRVAVLDYLIRLCGIVTLLFVLLETGSFILVSVYNVATKGAEDHRLNMDVYAGAQWAEEYFREFNATYDTEYRPYVGYGRPPDYAGEYINIDGRSVRKTINPCLTRSRAPIRIFAFGGSTMWGTGARDQGTIPSRLSKFLCDHGYSAEITNFGETGYTNSQDMIKLELELRRGNLPDIVIFYDGGNDVYSSYQNGVAGVPQNIQHRQREFNSRDEANIPALFPSFFKVLGAIKKTLRRTNVVSRPVSMELARQTSAVYLGDVRIIRSLGAEFGFEPLFYWQPVAYTKRQLSNDEKARIDHEQALADAYGEVSDLVQGSDDVTSLTDIFDEEPETIFIDWIHTSERGNTIIADQMGRDVIRCLGNRP